MAVSEEPDAMLQSAQTSPGALALALETQSWPLDLEICIEYCTRSPFHSRYDLDQYVRYFELVSEAFRMRWAQTKIVGNPFTGRRKIWISSDQFGQISEEVEMPRLGAFEVSVNCAQTGCVTIFSKLDNRRWPNPRILVLQVDRLLRGEDMLQALPPSSARGSSRSPRKPSPSKSVGGGTARSWTGPKTGASAGSSPRTPRSAAATSPERSNTAPAPLGASPPSSRKAGRKDKDKDKDKDKEVPVAQDSAPPRADSRGVAADAAFAATALPRVDGAASEFDDFEESGEGSSCFGTKVWMPGASMNEKWEDEESSQPTESRPEATKRGPEGEQSASTTASMEAGASAAPANM